MVFMPYLNMNLFLADPAFLFVKIILTDSGGENNIDREDTDKDHIVANEVYSDAGGDKEEKPYPQPVQMPKSYLHTNHVVDEEVDGVQVRRKPPSLLQDLRT